MQITPVTPSDLAAIVAIEQAGFSAAVAEDEAQYAARIHRLKDDFLVARAGDRVAGFIVGPATTAPRIADWMYAPSTESIAPGGGHQMVLTLAVDPAFRGQGLGSRLLAAFEDQARQKGRQSVALTCLAERIPFYEKNGYFNQGPAALLLGGERWYHQVKALN